MTTSSTTPIIIQGLYQWQVIDSNGDWIDDGEQTSNGSSYVVQPSINPGTQIRCRFTVTDGQVYPRSAVSDAWTVVAVTPQLSVLPLINSNVRQGDIVTATGVTLPEGWLDHYLGESKLTEFIWQTKFERDWETFRVYINVSSSSLDVYYQFLPGLQIRCIFRMANGPFYGQEAITGLWTVASSSLQPAESVLTLTEPGQTLVINPSFSPQTINWQRQINNQWTSIPRQTGSTYTVIESDDDIRCQVKFNNSITVYSGTWKVLYAVPNINQIVAAGTILTASVQVSNQFPLQNTFTWLQKQSLSHDFEDVPGEASPDFSATQAGMSYRCRIVSSSNAALSSVTSYTGVWTVI